MAFDEMMKQVAVTLERDGSVRAVFGEAIKLEHHTIVPVAVVSGGGGAGGSQGEQSAGGAGIALNVRPVGFISEHGDEVTFTPIHLEGPNKALLTEAALGVRKAIDLASSVIAQFARSRGRKVETTRREPRRPEGRPPIAAVPDDEPPAVMSPS